MWLSTPLIARPLRRIPQAPLFLEITKRLCDPDSYTKWKVANGNSQSTIAYLLRRGFYSHLRTLLLAIASSPPPAPRSNLAADFSVTQQPSSNRAHPAVPAAIVLSLLPFKAFPAPPTPALKSTPSPPIPALRLSSLSAFLQSILTIPLLLSRIPLPSLTLLAGSIPLDSLFLHAEANPESTTGLDPNDSAQLLANLVACGGKRVASLSSGKALGAYLRVTAALLDKLPKALFLEKKDEEDGGKGKMKEIVAVEDEAEDESEDEDADADAERVQRVRAQVGTAKDTDGDSEMASLPTITPSPSPVPTLDPRTLAFLLSLPSRPHLTSLLTLSTKFSATTRPALATFLVSILSTFPSKRDEVLNTIMYGSGSGSSERGGGLLREIWRGFIRTGPLGKLLSERNDRSAGRITNALRDPALVAEWPVLVLLTELYARTLRTLGDDEFYSQKNPLTLDEVVGLSAMLRNLAFALYWQEGIAGVEGDRTVVGTRMSKDGLRVLATTLLQQVHARE